MIDRKKLIDAFHIEYEETRMFEKISWLGTPMYKLPFDAIVLQELIYKIQPNIIIETGTARGGSALFFATLCELLDHGKVITVDIADKVSPSTFNNKIFKKRVIRHLGSSIDSAIVDNIKRSTEGAVTLVTLDSWHTKEHVLKELELYSPLTSRGSYIVVEDTHVNGNPVPWKWGEGPMEAVQEFLKTNDNFEVDKSCEKFYLTFSPNGYLKRIK